MTAWQKRARIGVAAVGIASAVIVYAAMGHRQAAPTAAALPRIDPKVILETTSGLLRQVRGSKEDFTVASERQLTYDDGSTKLLGVRISVQNRSGRDFIVTAKEATSGSHERTLQLNGDVRLVASDGFELTTDRGSFTQDDGLVRADGPIQFKRGGMKGSGTGMRYDKNADVLGIAHDPQITVTDPSGKTTMAFRAGGASLDRVHDILTLDEMVHVMRGDQVIDTGHATAQMSDQDEIVKSMELRGGSRVEGGDSAFDSMTARDIDLFYSDDGQTVRHASLSGAGEIAMRPNNGASGRQFMAESLDLTLAPDGSIEHGVGQQKFQMVLPATPDLPARRIQADQFDAHGAAGKGLTDATFAGNVVYREEALKQTAARLARAQQLRVTMHGDAIDDATFTGAVTFQEEALRATAGEARYNPGAGTLSLKPGAAPASPTVADNRITIDAQSVDVTLATHAMSAKGTVKTTLQASRGKAGAAGDEGAIHLPGLLKQDQPAHVNADAIEYDASANRAEYTGSASLWQGETAIRANAIVVDQGTGDLTATGNARAVLALDTGTSVSRAEVITYADAKHAIAYTTAAPATGAAAPGLSAPPATTPGTVQMNGPEGDLTAGRIDAFLGDGGGNLLRLEADGAVQIKLAARTVTGGHMVYHADTGEYVMAGTAAAPVKVVESCRETTGKTLTFFKATDRIIVDGNQEIRTQTKSGGACPQPSR